LAGLLGTLVETDSRVVPTLTARALFDPDFCDVYAMALRGHPARQRSLSLFLLIHLFRALDFRLDLGERLTSVYWVEHPWQAPFRSRLPAQTRSWLNRFVHATSADWLVFEYSPPARQAAR
jgi:hypothetical protein